MGLSAVRRVNRQTIFANPMDIKLSKVYHLKDSDPIEEPKNSLT